MKMILLSALMAITTNVAFSTIRTVSNQTPLPGQFSTIQAAINASASGDTILVHPSQFDYADFNLDRQLTIIGNGFEPPGSIQYPYSKIIITNPQFGVHITSVAASGSILCGLYFAAPMDMVAGLHDLTITRCRFDNTQIRFPLNGYNMVITENIFFEAGLLYMHPGPGNSYNFLVANNVFRQNGGNRAFDNINGVTNFMVTNNLFYGTGTNNFIVSNASSGFIFSNNIFNKINFTGLSVSTFSNNLTYQCTGNTPWINNGTDLGIPALGTQNIANTAPDFVNAANINLGGWNGTNGFTVNAGSPTLSSMPGDADMGPYGGNGAYNFNRSSASNLPYVHSIVIGNPAIQAGTDLNIDVVGKKHD